MVNILCMITNDELGGWSLYEKNSNLWSKSVRSREVYGIDIVGN